ncbi:GtrA family protein [Entomomonas moraniae]|uniref:GtrA family protein n=1 Tax=Entomomonas moraniae TaxID=2213226 RepID=A0A451EQJ0_9GAMM|nr:GtrA family protein [Entomomonas moraniae]AZS52110.1 GtrA family protein [Entomomonas moraniae]
MLFDPKLNSQFISYCLVGAVITVGGLLTSLLLIWLGMSIYVANLLVYLIGCVVSYVLNSKLTFKKNYSRKRALKFFISIGVAYIINVLLIYLTLFYQPGAKYIAQIIGNVFYTLLVFSMNKFWVMK